MQPPRAPDSTSPASYSPPDHDYLSLLETSQEAIAAFDEEWRFVYVNAMTERLLGRSRHELLGGVLWELFSGAAPYQDALTGVRELGESLGWQECGAFSGLCLRVRAERLDGLVVVRAYDDTARSESERALRESENRYRQVFESNPIPMFIWDLETLKIVHVNRAALQRYGYTEDELRAMTMFDLRPEEDVPRLRTEIPRLRADDEERDTMRHRAKDGTVLDVEIVAHTVSLEGRLFRVASARDVTEAHRADAALRRSEAQLRQAQKMDAVGRLAGGIAHDFNNILTVIRAHGEFLKEAIPSGTEQRGDLEEIRRAATRAASLTRQLLAFSRQQVLDPRPVDINAVVTALMKTIGRLVGDDIELTVHLGQGVGQTLADQGQLEQVLINLAVNARDAMPKGGELAVTTGLAELEVADVAQHPEAKPGTYVTMVVRDSGTGMDEATLSRIFEPFFTTKPPGKGTGLGLATVYGIVQQSGGIVQVMSAPGEGTTFTVFLPQLSGTGVVATASPELPGLEGTETILLVEDEDAVRTLARRILSRLGYTVLEAQHGGEALTIAAGYDGAIDLLVTDAVMPQMSGADLTRALKVLRPVLPVLFVSGYTDEEIARGGTVDEAWSFLHKPFAAEQLARAVRDALDRSMRQPT